MAVLGRVSFLVVLLSLAFAVTHNHSEETETCYVSVGHLFVLKCHIADAHTNVTWSKDGRPLPTGVEVRDGLLWFLPVHMSHNGSYTCEKRDGSQLNFWVSVSSGECPDPSETKSIPKEVNGGLPCKQNEVFGLNKTRNIRWMKDCHPVEQQGRRVLVDEDGFIRLFAASETDAGKYTCLVDISLDGRKYTAARSIQLTTESGIEDSIFTEHVIIYPQQEVVVVEVDLQTSLTQTSKTFFQPGPKKFSYVTNGAGTTVDLRCLAYIGFTEDSEILTYWTIDSNYPEDYKGVNESWKYIHDGGRVYYLSNLSISEVRPEFLNVPIHCHVESPTDKKVGLMLLQEADYSAVLTSVSRCLSASLICLALAVGFYLFKVDLLLVYRKLLRHFAKHQAPDGKLYDAYVSFLHSDASSAETANFAQQILPERLEKQHGYSLYIRGRDDCPGEAVHDVIATTVRQCRRLIIILSPEAKFFSHGNNEEEPLCDNQNQLCYEQKIGLYDALTLNDPKVILVEIGAVDYSCLPESLRYVKRKQGSLKWEKPSLGTKKLSKLCQNRNFWKNLRYYMPSVPTGRLQTVAEIK